MADINCCLGRENPCQNDGRCEAVAATDHTKPRFRCVCAVGYTGELCQQPIRSCRAYAKGNRVPGVYMVRGMNDRLYEVFCDFDTDTMMAWTLVQSYTLKNNVYFYTRSLLTDVAVNQEIPTDFSMYRLSRTRMLLIHEDSTKWRMTCDYETNGVKYDDYVRGSKESFDILNYDAAYVVGNDLINIVFPVVWIPDPFSRIGVIVYDTAVHVMGFESPCMLSEARLCMSCKS